MNNPNVPCPRCGGTGEEPGAPIDLDVLGTPLCECCDGTGEITLEQAAQRDTAGEEED